MFIISYLALYQNGSEVKHRFCVMLTNLCGTERDEKKIAILFSLFLFSFSFLQFYEFLLIIVRLGANAVETVILTNNADDEECDGENIANKKNVDFHIEKRWYQWL